MGEVGLRAGIPRRGRSEPSGTTVADLFVSLLYRNWRLMTWAVTLSHIVWFSELHGAPLCVLCAVAPLVSHGHLGVFFTHSSQSPFPRHSAPRSLSS
jgi:hypothetical protein